MKDQRLLDSHFNLLAVKRNEGDGNGAQESGCPGGSPLNPSLLLQPEA